MVVYRNINGVDFGVNINKSSSLLCSQEIAEIIDGDIYEFVEYLYSIKNEYTPMIATWEITNACNFECPFCYINTPKKTVTNVQSYNNMKKSIDELVEEGLLIVYLTGGEILSVPDFDKIYRYIKEKGVFVVLLTNLSLLNEKHMELFRDYPPLHITNSIYGIKPEQFRNVTGHSFDLCEKILNNILLIKEMGINITCQMPVNDYTINDLIDISEWCYSNGIRFTFNNEITDSYYNESRSEAFIKNEIFEKYRKQIRQIESIKSSKIASIERKFGYRYYFDCVSGKHTYAVSYDGHLRPCFNIWESDFVFFDGSKSMKSAMTELREFVNRMKKTIIEGCKGCDASQICGECLYTRLKHRDNLTEFIRDKCKENMTKINQYMY